MVAHTGGLATESAAREHDRVGILHEPEAYAFRHHPIFGTVVEVRLDATDVELAGRVERAVVSEMIRLERVFSAFDPDSELQRWKRCDVERPSAELTAVLAAAAEWQDSSNGAFNPMSGVLTGRWRRAEREGEVPDPGELAELARSIDERRFAIEDGRPVPRGDCADLQLSAFARGWVVDRAVEAGRSVAGAAAGVERLTVNAGGDFAHRGPIATIVGIDDPHRHQPGSPIARVRLHGAGLATSERVRRGFEIGDRWFSHVVDPRSGQTVDHLASVTVAADSAALADAAAAVVGVEPVEVAIQRADELGVACLLVDRVGRHVANARWQDVIAPAA
jgi:thiamine biosynthesis lipoprotein